MALPADIEMDDTLLALAGPRAVAEHGGHAPRSKRWLITLNNPAGYTPTFKADVMDYMVWQLERGEQGTEHWHAYIRTKARMSLGGVKKLFDGHNPHIDVARGNEKSCHDYCTKEDTRIAVGSEHGEYLPDIGSKGQGERTDLAPIAKACKDGKSLREIATDHPEVFVKYHSGIAALHALVAPLPPVRRRVKTLVMWGDTGTGKSYRVAEQFPDAYKVRPGRDPWGNYRGEDVICFDEFNHTKWSIFEMNEYLDENRCKLDRRYTDIYANWTCVIICANSNPTSWFPDAAQLEINAFRRRLADGCRFVSNRLEDITKLPPNPDFSYLVPPPIAAPVPAAAAAAAPVYYLTDSDDEVPRSPPHKIIRHNATLGDPTQPQTQS